MVHAVTSCGATEIHRHGVGVVPSARERFHKQISAGVTMIKPTIGRKVWFWAHEPAGGYEGHQPEDATVVFVFNESMVNLRVTDHSGNSRAETSVFLWQGEGEQPVTRHAQWMPYQLGQAKAQSAAA